MAILLTDVPGGLRPEHASCAWPTSDLRFWRNINRVCFLRLQIRGYDTTGGHGPAFGFRGGWWSGIIVDPTFGSCGASDPLVSFWSSVETYTYLDVWRALSLGLWTSSLVIELIPVAYTGRVGLYVGPEFEISPPTLNPPSKVVPSPGSCSSGVAWSITVRDDGTFSVV